MGADQWNWVSYVTSCQVIWLSLIVKQCLQIVISPLSLPVKVTLLTKNFPALKKIICGLDYNVKKLSANLTNNNLKKEEKQKKKKKVSIFRHHVLHLQHAKFLQITNFLTSDLWITTDSTLVTSTLMQVVCNTLTYFQDKHVLGWLAIWFSYLFFYLL